MKIACAAAAAVAATTKVVAVGRPCRLQRSTASVAASLAAETKSEPGSLAS